MNHKKFLVYIFLIFSFNSLGCGSTPIPLFDISSTEYYRIKSPDAKVDAVLMESNGGATTSLSYNLYILPQGATTEKLSLDYSKLIADKAEDIRIIWIENKVLQVDCKSARIFEFSNFWQSKDIEDYRYIVEIRISPTCRLKPSVW